MREGNPPRIRMLLADVGSIRFVQKKRAASYEVALGMESYLMKYLSRSPLTASGDECAIRTLFCILILYILAHSFFAHVPDGTYVIVV